MTWHTFLSIKYEYALNYEGVYIELKQKDSCPAVRALAKYLSTTEFKKLQIGRGKMWRVSYLYLIYPFTTCDKFIDF